MKFRLPAFSPSCYPIFVLAALTCVPAASVQAHAPLARELALSPAGGALAVRMPGFGWLLRGDAQQPFAYACDALVGVEPVETVTPMAYRADGVLLIGSEHGLRMLDRDGCPLPADSSDLGDVALAALAVHPAADGVVYAVSAGSAPAVYASDDGGAHWQLRSTLAQSGAVSGLRLRDDDADAVYVSQDGADARSLLLTSEDGGRSFTSVAQERALRLLDVQSGSAARLWAVSPAPDARGGRGFDIMRASLPEGPWQAVLRLNFFGGFARDRDGAIWVGDEGGGVFRSSDGGDHFDEVLPAQAVACLAAGDGALWACTPGTAAKRAVAMTAGSDSSAPLADVLAFSAVDHMVACTDVDVGAVCAAAWHEWEVDVRMQATSTPDAGAPSAQEPHDAGLGDAGSTVPTVSHAGERGSGGCSASAGVSTSRRSSICLIAGLCLALIRRRARARRRV